MNEISRPAWLPLGSLLLREGLVSPEQLELALLAQEQDRRRLGEILVEWGWVSSRAIAEALSEQYGIRFLDLEVADVDEQAAANLDEDLAEEYQALPIRFLPDGVLLVAVADPTDVGACDELREVISVPIRLVVVDAVVLAREIQRQRAGLKPV